MEEKKPLKIKFKTAVVLVIIGAIILTIFGANVYAVTNGYGNVFFLIKYLVTGEKPEISGKDELLSDRDITISYESIALTENIKIQIRNLQIEDNKAKLFIAVNDNNQSTEDTPLMYKVYNEENKLICEQKSSKEANNETEYIDELLLNEFKNDEKVLHLEIFNSKNEKLTRITINLETREIVVDGEKEAIEKISEIELKKFLGHITALEPYKDSDDERILFAGSMFAQKEELNVNKLDELNKMLDATGYERLSNPLKNAQYFKIVNKGGTNYIEVTVGRGGFEPNTVIEIKEISYCGGLYTAKFNYAYIHEPDVFNPSHLDELDIKEATVYFRKNEDTTYSTFKVVKFESNNMINITEKEAKLVLEDKYKKVENMWLDVTEFFKTDLGKEVKNFEGTVLTYGTEKFLNQVKNNLPWGMYMENGKYFIAEGWGGDIGYDGLKEFENIRITESSITATVVTKQKKTDENDWVPDKDRKSEFILIKSGNKWLVDYFDFKGIFENEDPILENSKTEYEQTDEVMNIITQLTPSGFAGSSLNRVNLYSNKDVYLITYDGGGFEESNIISKELIARNVDSISKSEDGDIYIKGGIQIKDDLGWIHFETIDNVSDDEIENEIRNVMGAYIELLGARISDVTAPLYKLDLKYKESNQDAKKIGYNKTNILYSKFKEEMLKYMTEKCFNTEMNADNVYIEEDGFLCHSGGAASGHDYKLKEITKISDKVYQAEVLATLEEDTRIIYFEIGVEKQNGKYVVDYSRQINI